MEAGRRWSEVGRKVIGSWSEVVASWWVVVVWRLQLGSTDVMLFELAAAQLVSIGSGSAKSFHLQG